MNSKNSILFLIFTAGTIAATDPTRAEATTAGSEAGRNIRIPDANGHLRAVVDYVEAVPDPDYQHASVEAYEAFRDLKFGVRIHWGLYSIWNLQNESWPFLRMSNEERQRYQELFRTWNPAGFNAEDWMTSFKAGGARFFTFTTRHHEGFSMFDTATRVHARTNWMAPGGPQIEACDLAYSITETPFHRDVVAELTAAAHRHNLKIDLYYSWPDWYDADFRPYAGHPLRVADMETWSPYDLEWVARRFNPDHPPETMPDPTPAEESRMMRRLHDQLIELVTRYGQVDMIGLDQWLGPRTWPGVKAIIKELRRLRPDLMFRARGIGNYGDYFTPERFVPGDPQNTGMPWFVIYPLARSFSYDPVSENYKGARWIIHTLVDTVAKGGNFEIGIGPDADGKFHPTAIAQMKEAGEWLKRYGDAIYGTRTRPGEKWRDGDNVRFTRTKDSSVIYAICLTWPGTKLVLHDVSVNAGSEILLLGWPDPIAWRIEGGDVVIDLGLASPQHEEHAYVFKIYGR